MLGRGENDQKVREWLGTARKVPGFIGFAVGRTVFWDPLVDWKAGKAGLWLSTSPIRRMAKRSA